MHRSPALAKPIQKQWPLSLHLVTDQSSPGGLKFTLQFRYVSIILVRLVVKKTRELLEQVMSMSFTRKKPETLFH